TRHRDGLLLHCWKERANGFRHDGVERVILSGRDGRLQVERWWRQPSAGEGGKEFQTQIGVRAGPGHSCRAPARTAAPGGNLGRRAAAGPVWLLEGAHPAGTDEPRHLPERRGGIGTKHQDPASYRRVKGLLIGQLARLALEKARV